MGFTAIEDDQPEIEPSSSFKPLAKSGGFKPIEETPEPSAHYISDILRGTRATGNKFLDALSYLDRPRNALAVGVRDEHQGKDFTEGAIKGFRGEDFASTQQLTPEDMKPFDRAALGFFGDVATDPLTYLGGTGIWRKAVEGTAKGVSKVLPGLERRMNNSFTRALNINTGDSKLVKEFETKYKDLTRGQTSNVINEAGVYNTELKGLSNDLGMDIGELKGRIVDQIENPQVNVDPKIEAAADEVREMNSWMLQEERNLGLDVGELPNYITHVLTKEGRKAIGKEKSKDILFDMFRANNPKHGSMKHRKVEGTIKDINEQRIYGTDKLFYDDPVITQSVRQARHIQSTNAQRFLDDVSSQFGKTDDAPEHFVESTSVKGVKFDPQVKKQIDAVYSKMTSSEEIDQFLNTYDGAQRWWKMWSLGARPAYHARNIVGNVWNNYLGGVKNPEVYRDATILQAQAAKKNFTGNIAGKSHEEIYEAANLKGVLGRGQYHDDIVESTLKEIEDKLSNIKGTDFVTMSTDNFFLQTGFKFGGVMEENARLAHFIDKVKKGYSYDEAAKSVKKYLFDYSDLSNVEQKVFKRVIPFYTWSRKNIPLQAEALLKSPEKAQKLNIAISQSHQQTEVPDQEDVPDWLKDQGPVYFGKTPDGDAKAITLMNYLPLMDLDRTRNPEEFVNMISPFIKEPIQQFANYDTFREEEITKWKGQTVDFMGVKLPAWQAHVLRNLIMLNEIDRLNPGGVFGENIYDKKTGKREITRGFGLDKEIGGESYAIGATRESRTDLEGPLRWIQYATGIRPYPVDTEQGEISNLIQLKKDIGQIKKNLRRAHSKGNERAIEEIEKILDNY